MRTLAIFHVAEPGGPLRSLGAELSWLAGLGSLDLLVPDDGELDRSLTGNDRVRRLDYTALTVPPGPRAAAAEARRLAGQVRAFRAEIRRARADLVLIVSATLPAALFAARLEGVPAIVYAGEVLDGGELRGLQRRIPGRLVVEATKRFAAGVVACSRTVADQYEGGRSSVAVIYPPLRDDYASGDRDGFRARHGIGADDVCLAAVGNISEQRGQDTLLLALAEVRRSFPTARCLIAGEALPRGRDLAFRNRLVEMARVARLDQAVSFTGFVDPVADLYAAADVVVNPTRYESFGRVGLEAALAGRPVVSTTAGAIPEVLTDEESALLVPPDDHVALAAAIVRVLGDETLAKRIVAGGRAFAAANLDGDRALAAFQSLVAQALDEPRAGRPGATAPRRPAARSG